ncbi:MAG TPA: hypothetical protein VFU15_07390, partial [Bacteroidia bacterium]|nr:hypothetical protein [Bacteroidia bacterium]
MTRLQRKWRSCKILVRVFENCIDFGRQKIVFCNDHIAIMNPSVTFLGESAKFTANTGIAKVSTANSGLDGGGTLKKVLTAAGNGTYIATVTLKAPGNTGTSGTIIRLFIDDGVNVRLLSEHLLGPTGGGTGSVFPTYCLVIPMNYT